MEYSCSINALKNGLWYALLLFVAYVLFQYWRILKKKNLGILIYDIVLLWRVGYRPQKKKKKRKKKEWAIVLFSSFLD